MIFTVEANREKEKRISYLLRFQTALIVESQIGKGQGVRYVMESWKLEDEPELSAEDVRELLKKKKEAQYLKKIKNGRGVENTDRG